MNTMRTDKSAKVFSAIDFLSAQYHLPNQQTEEEERDSIYGAAGLEDVGEYLRMVKNYG